MADIEIYQKAELEIKNARAVYLDHESRVSKAIEAIDSYYQLAKNGMTEDLYANIGGLIKKLNNTIESFKESRKPITSAAQDIVKLFTSQENILDVKNEKSRIFELKKMMDNYADQKEKERKQKEREEQIKLDKKREFAKVQIDTASFFTRVASRSLHEFKLSVQELLRIITLSNFNLITTEIKKQKIKINDNLIDLFNKEVLSAYLSEEERLGIYNEYLSSTEWTDLKEKIILDSIIYLQEAVQTFPSIKLELEDLALADAKESERILREKQQREEEARHALIQEQENEKKHEEERNKLLSSQQELQSQIELGAAVASLDTNIKTKSIYEVVVTMPSGLLEIANFWITGQNWPMDEQKVMNVTFDRMVRFAEKEAISGKFIKSKFVTYNEKAISKI